MNWSKSGQLNQQNMLQFTIKGELSAIVGMAATACNKVQQHCVDLVLLKLEVFYLLLLKRLNGQLIYYAVYRSWQIWKQGMVSWMQSASLQKSGFSCMESGNGGACCRIAPQISLAELNLFVICYDDILSGSAAKAQAHVCTIQPSL